MIFDSDEQKKMFIDLIGQVPVATTVLGMVMGPEPELRNLVTAMGAAHVLSVDDQTVAMLHLEEIGKVKG